MGADSPRAEGAANPGRSLRDRLDVATRGRYQIIRQIGEGGMAAVFLGRHLGLQREVAIKVMAPGLLTTDGMVERFLAEARTIAQFRCQNIVQVFEVERVSDDLYFFVMEYIRGNSLDRILRGTGRMPVNLVRAILYEVGQGLMYAHRFGVIHRDVKPSNIMVNAEGLSILTDFGIAKQTDSEGTTLSGARVGTPTYMSPEQCNGVTLTWASDQYSLGVVAYEMLVGRPPFEGKSFEVQAAHVSSLPPSIQVESLDCPAEFASAIARMLEKQPEQRWPSIADALRALGCQAVADGEPTRSELAVLAMPEPALVRIPEPDRPVNPPPPWSAGKRSGPEPLRRVLIDPIPSVSRTPIRSGSRLRRSIPRVILIVTGIGNAVLAVPMIRSMRSPTTDGTSWPIAAGMGAGEAGVGLPIAAGTPAIAALGEDTVASGQLSQAPVSRVGTRRGDVASEILIGSAGIGQLVVEQPVESQRVMVGDSIGLIAYSQTVASTRANVVVDWTTTDSTIAIIRGRSWLVARAPGRVFVRASMADPRLQTTRMLEVVPRAVAVRPIVGGADSAPSRSGSDAAMRPAAADPTARPIPRDSAASTSAEPSADLVLRSAMLLHAAKLMQADLLGIQTVYPVANQTDRLNLSRLIKLLKTREYRLQIDGEPAISGSPDVNGLQAVWSYGVRFRWRNNFGATMNEIVTFETRFRKSDGAWQLVSARILGNPKIG